MIHNRSVFSSSYHQILKKDLNLHLHFEMLEGSSDQLEIALVHYNHRCIGVAFLLYRAVATIFDHRSANSSLGLLAFVVKIATFLFLEDDLFRSHGRRHKVHFHFLFDLFM